MNKKYNGYYMSKKHIEYLKLQKDAEHEYGEKTVVLYQMGIFYEIYCYNVEHCESEEDMFDYDGIKWETSVGDAVAIKKTLNCKRGSKNNNKPHGVKNPYLLGFPVGAYDDNLETLLAHGYVVIRYDQDKVKSVKKKDNVNNIVKIKSKRIKADICNPNTHIDFIPQNVINSYIMSVYIEYKQSNNEPPLSSASVGVAVLDALSGKSKICEYYSKKVNPSIYIQQLYSFILSHKPKELLVNITNVPTDNEGKTEKLYLKYVDDKLELTRYERVTKNVNKVGKEYSKISYQIECFNKLFASRETNNNHNKKLKPLRCKNDDIIEKFGLNMFNYGRIAYILLMEKCNNSCPDILKKLDPPDIAWIDESTRLVLTYNSLIQLNVIDSEKANVVKAKKENLKITSLLSLLDQNVTNLGRNLLYSTIQSPMVNPDEIRSYYDMIDESKNILIESKPLWKILELKLRDLPDMDRLNRKLMTGRISPKELSNLIKGYKTTADLFNVITTSKAEVFKKNLLCKEDLNNLSKLIEYIDLIINPEDMTKCVIIRSDSDLTMSFVDNPFCVGVNLNIDDVFHKMCEYYKQLHNIILHLNSFLKGSGLKIPELKKGKKKTDGYQLKILGTYTQAKTLLTVSYDELICGKLFTNNHTSTEKEITSSLIENLINDIVNAETKLMTELYIQYTNTLNEIINIPPTSTFFTKINDAIAKIDLIHNYTKISIKYNYSRPIIDDNEDMTDTEIPSFINLTELRHPIIERIIDGPYITNNLSIKENGMVIYGHNKVGKTSIILATGLILIMAQAGCFVPCTTMKYFPYNKLFTRMASGDAILLGKSSFDVEMTELGMILNQADKRSFVMANELACSTESLSASAISGSAVIRFVDLKCGFMLASHAYNLIDFPQIKSLPAERLRICHLSVDKDIMTDMLIYNRKLVNGLGNCIYGVRVAESIISDTKFISIAYEMLNGLNGKTNKLVSTKTSNYCKDLYVTECMLCGSPKTKELITHHIIHQKDSNNGIVYTSESDKMHVHSKDNLMFLCEDCHHKVHTQGLEFKVLDTLEGKLICQEITEK
jgi:DNA mismatch repair protein MutS